jgi:aspartyl protease family protein
MVDTGATAVALSAESARRLGIRPPQSAFRMPIDTANGIAYAAPVKLGEVRIGNVSVRNVEAIVVPGDALSINLLGMTFLSRLSRFEVAGGQLVLTQ